MGKELKIRKIWINYTKLSNSKIGKLKIVRENLWNLFRESWPTKTPKMINFRLFNPKIRHKLWKEILLPNKFAVKKFLKSKYLRKIPQIYHLRHSKLTQIQIITRSLRAKNRHNSLDFAWEETQQKRYKFQRSIKKDSPKYLSTQMKNKEKIRGLKKLKKVKQACLKSLTNLKL